MPLAIFFFSNANVVSCCSNFLVFEFNRNSVIEAPIFSLSLHDDQEYGEITFYLRTNDASKESMAVFESSEGNTLFKIRISKGKLQYYNANQSEWSDL